MSNIKVFFKNFTAGRKALFKRMGIYLASSLAVFEAANIFLEDGAVGQWCEAVSLGGITLKSVLTNVLVYLGVGAIIALLRQSSFAHYCMNIVGTDVKIEISMSDIFSNKGEIVVPCNTTFSGRKQVIGGKSIQTQMTNRICFPKGEEAPNVSNDEYFEQTVDHALQRPECQARKLSGQKELAGKLYDIFQYGTMAPVSFPVQALSRGITGAY